jgi:ABC-type lipoprotein export system ATPase subunit
MKEINRSFKTTFVFSTHDKKVIAKADQLYASKTAGSAG